MRMKAEVHDIDAEAFRQHDALLDVVDINLYEESGK